VGSVMLAGRDAAVHHSEHGRTRTNETRTETSA
jgi:hypothetical protein